MKLQILFLSIFALAFNVPTLFAKKAKVDPDECQVCIEVLEAVDAALDKDEKKSQISVEVRILLFQKNRETVIMSSSL